MKPDESNVLERLKKKYPNKFISDDIIFSCIRRGSRIFIGTACGQPQYLVHRLVEYVKNHPKAFFDTEVIQVWTLGLAPYLDEKLKANFRLNSFFIGNSIRDKVNQATADYTPVFLSQVPSLFHRGIVPLDVALVQTSLPDRHNQLSLGISVDIVRAAVQNADVVIAQCNKNMPRVFGDTFIHIKDIDYIVPKDEMLLTADPGKSGKVADQIAKYIGQIVQDGDTIQVGYGSLRNRILAGLRHKKHLGIHTELLSDGFIDLIRAGVVDNSKKTIDRGKTVAAFCMGSKVTYNFLHNNPQIEIKSVEYTNHPLVISKIKNMTAINSVLEIDLTGQATSESINTVFYSGIGGFADFMRGAAMAEGSKMIVTLPSTAENGIKSRIVPYLSPGAGVTLTRGDVHYVVTEYGIAYLHGKNIRERAMSLISIAHPNHRPWLVENAKDLHLIYVDQNFMSGKHGEYPEDLQTYRTTKQGLRILLRPVRMDDEHLLKDFFYSLSDKSMYRRFFSTRLDMPHEQLQKFTIIDYSREMVLLAMNSGMDRVLGVGQFVLNEDSFTAEVAFAVRDEYQHKGVGFEILLHLIFIAKKKGLTGFSAQILAGNEPALRLMKNLGRCTKSHYKDGVYDIFITLTGHPRGHDAQNDNLQD
ncbi:GNAT family N-acetyltransferase [candidate division KSB1 bacterium]|nr:GNAT family N-acetyltransferase [candidate division KSB1 bacterium]